MLAGVASAAGAAIASAVLLLLLSLSPLVLLGVFLFSYSKYGYVECEYECCCFRFARWCSALAILWPAAAVAVAWWTSMVNTRRFPWLAISSLQERQAGS